MWEPHRNEELSPTCSIKMQQMRPQHRPRPGMLQAPCDSFAHVGCSLAAGPNRFCTPANEHPEVSRPQSSAGNFTARGFHKRLSGQNAALRLGQILVGIYCTQASYSTKQPEARGHSSNSCPGLFKKLGSQRQNAGQIPPRGWILPKSDNYTCHAGRLRHTAT